MNYKSGFTRMNKGSSMKVVWKTRTFLCLFFVILFCFTQNIFGADADKQGEEPPPLKPPQLTLHNAVMCEGLKDLEPENETIVFSVALGSVICFTAFDPVPKKTFVHHNWFKREQLEKKLKLTLKPPKWSSFSKIHVRNMDVGPWRVEITDSEGKIFQTLRFSVTE
jgi:Protein of unknown function (DUF2914)